MKSWKKCIAIGMAALLTASLGGASFASAAGGSGKLDAKLMKKAAAVTMNKAVKEQLASSIENDIYVFSPKSTSTYVVFSKGTTDTFGSIYDASGKLIASNDNSDGKNFAFSAGLTANKKYYISVKLAAKAKAGPYQLNITHTLIHITYDKTAAKVGDIVTATVNVNNMKAFSGYQINLKYNPSVVQPVTPGTLKPYQASTKPQDGKLLTDGALSPLSIASNDIKSGILNFGKTSMSPEVSKILGNKVYSGSIAVISFQVLKISSDGMKLRFEATRTIPQSAFGVSIIDGEYNEINGYYILQPEAVKIK